MLKNSKAKAVIYPVENYVGNFYFSYTKNPLTNDNDIWVGYHIGQENYPLNDLSFLEIILKMEKVC